MTPSLLALEDIKVRAGSRTILDVTGLSLAAGTTLAVLGPNGAGKSTLLRVAAALLSPTSGRVLLDGRPAARSQLRAVTSAVLQRPLLQRGTVRQNVGTGMRFHGVAGEEIRTRTTAWMQRLGIAELERRAATSLSGGEAQRVSLARALAVEPRLLLLDEPFVALDAPTRGELIADLREVLSDTGTSALLVTHDRDEAAALADAIAVLHAGTLRQHGPAGHVLEHPADADCARTLGFENVLRADVAERLLGASGPVALHAGDCGVHPAGAGGGVVARLRRVVPLGPVARVTVEVGDCPLHATAPMPVPAWLGGLAAGDELELTIRPQRARPLGSVAAGEPRLVALGSAPDGRRHS